MYDTVHLWLERGHYADIADTIDAITSPCSITGVQGTTILGYVGNMRVAIKDAGISIKGSLSKFLNGENQSPLSRHTAKEAIEVLANTLHLPIERANVTRIDVAANIITTYEPRAYYPCYGTARYYNRLEQNNGIYYNNKKRQMLLYGKVHEQEHVRKIDMLPIYQGKQLIRYEYRLLSSPKKQLNQSELTASKLYNHQFYKQILEKWKDEYFAIKRNKILHFKPEIMNSSKDFERQLMQLGIQAIGGQAGAMAMIEQAKRQNIFDNKMQEKRLKDKINNLAKMPEMKENELTKEIDRQVNDIANNWA